MGARWTLIVFPEENKDDDDILFVISGRPIRWPQVPAEQLSLDPILRPSGPKDDDFERLINMIYQFQPLSQSEYEKVRVPCRARVWQLRRRRRNSNFDTMLLLNLVRVELCRRFESSLRDCAYN